MLKMCAYKGINSGGWMGTRRPGNSIQNFDVNDQCEWEDRLATVERRRSTCMVRAGDTTLT